MPNEDFTSKPPTSSPQSPDAASPTLAVASAGTTPPAAPADAGTDAVAFHEGFQRVEAEIRAVPPERLMPINFDVRGVVTTILGVYPEVFALRSEIAKLPVSLAAIDKLRDYALALGHTHSRLTLSVETTDDLAALATEGAALRDQLHADAQALAKRGIIRSEFVSRFRSGNGYRNIAFDLAGLAEVFVDAWDKLDGKTFLKIEEVEHARRLGTRMAQLLGLREQGPVVRDQAAILRQQAYVLCAQAYEEARHAVAFVRRREGDADSITPSLFAGRGGRGTQPEGAPSDPAAPTTNTPATALGSLTPNDSIPVGHPGSPAFPSS